MGGLVFCNVNILLCACGVFCVKVEIPACQMQDRCTFWCMCDADL